MLTSNVQIVSNKCAASVGARRTTVRRAVSNNRSASAAASARRLNKNALRSSSVIARAGNKIDTDEIVATVTEKWEEVEDKPQFLLYAGGAVVALTLANSLVGAINAIPLLPKAFELVGLGYSAWFTYNYLLFKSNRAELAADIEELKSKITSGGSK